MVDIHFIHNIHLGRYWQFVTLPLFRRRLINKLFKINKNVPELENIYKNSILLHRFLFEGVYDFLFYLMNAKPQTHKYSNRNKVQFMKYRCYV